MLYGSSSRVTASSCSRTSSAQPLAFVGLARRRAGAVQWPSHPARVERRAFGEPAGQGGHQLSDAGAGAGRNGEVLLETPLPDRAELGQYGRPGHAVNLVDHAHMAVGAGQPVGHEAVTAAYTGLPVDDQDDDVDSVDGVEGGLVEPLAQQRPGFVQPRRVHEHDLAPPVLSTACCAPRVVCGLSETMETLRPIMVLTRLDLPTLARPTRVTRPARAVAGEPFPVSGKATARLRRRPRLTSR